MSILDRDMIKQAVSELVDKAIDEWIGSAGDIEVTCVKKKNFGECCCVIV